MKCILLCAGYATRLYPLTRDKPKPLLSVGGKPVLEHILSKILPLEKVDEIFLVTNDKFYEQFKSWTLNFTIKNKIKKNIEVINDNTLTNETRLGGLGDMFLAIREKEINEDILVLAGDNVFTFELERFIETCESLRKSAVGLYDVENINEAKKLGVVEINDKREILSFEEKPQQPKSTLASVGIYFYPKEVLQLIDEYIQGNNPMDGPGFFVKWLHSKGQVNGFRFSGKWFDIGSFETLEKADKELS